MDVISAVVSAKVVGEVILLFVSIVSEVGKNTNIRTARTTIAIILMTLFINLRRRFCHLSMGAISAESRRAKMVEKLGMAIKPINKINPTAVHKAIFLKIFIGTVPFF